MTLQKPAYSAFRQRLLGREHLLGTFLKLPSTQPVEIFGEAGFDFVVIDQEHAPLGRAEVDLIVLASRASNVTPLVRVGDTSDASVLQSLDCGAMGIMFPHVVSVDKAKAIVSSCRYAGGSRGFAGMTRAGRWGAAPGPQHMRDQDSRIAVIAMIEDVAAVEHAGAIAAVEGVDALFVGRGDLTAAFGDDPAAKDKVAKLTERIAAAARSAGKPLMVLASSKADADTMRGLGATAILVASDHNFLKSAATAALKEYAPAGG